MPSPRNPKLAQFPVWVHPEGEEVEEVVEEDGKNKKFDYLLAFELSF